MLQNGSHSKQTRLWQITHNRPFKTDGSITIETNSFETIHLRPFIWDHLFETINLRPRSFETTTFETTFHLRLIHLRPLCLRPVHLRPVHLRPRSFETTFIWDHIHLRPHSFEATFIWDYINLRWHSFYAMLKWSCFDLLCITFCDLPFTFLRETWSFPRWLFIWNFARLRPSVSRGDSRWFVKAPALRAGSRGAAGIIDPGPSLQRGTAWW